MFSLRRATGETTRFVLVCIVLGVAVGVGAWIIKGLTRWLSHAAVSGLVADGIPWRFLFLPIIAIVAVGCFQRYVIHRRLDHGTDRINEALLSRRLAMPWSVVYGTLLGTSFTLGLGGSAGAEAPIAYVGAALGSRFGKWLRLSPRTMALLVAIGAGAGIAGIFKAPMGGILFAVEVLTFNLSTAAIVGLTTACLSAAITCYAMQGFTPDLVFGFIPDFDPVLLVWAIPLGAVCGIYSAYYSHVMNRMTAMYESINHPWLSWLLSGATIAVMVFSLPALFGEGYTVIGRILDGHGHEAMTFGSWLNLIPGITPTGTLLIITGAVVLCKAAASAATNAGGGIAGDFAPTIFAGSTVGFLFATVATSLLGFSVAPTALVFMAMGGVMAGAVRAPLMAMFLVAEMTGAFVLFMPMAITCALSYVTMLFVTRVFRFKKIHITQTDKS